MCGLFWGAHKSLAPRARTLLGGLGQATLSSFAVATLLFVLFGECPKFCDLAKQRRKIVGGFSEVGKDDFSLYFFWRCVIFLVHPSIHPSGTGTWQGELGALVSALVKLLEYEVREDSNGRRESWKAGQHRHIGQ